MIYDCINSLVFSFSFVCNKICITVSCKSNCAVYFSRIVESFTKKRALPVHAVRCVCTAQQHKNLETAMDHEFLEAVCSILMSL